MQSTTTLDSDIHLPALEHLDLSDSCVTDEVITFITLRVIFFFVCCNNPLSYHFKSVSSIAIAGTAQLQ
jgi:hypothetical protein